MRVNVFDCDRGFVDKDADGQGEAAESHQIDVLLSNPECEGCGKQRKRDVKDHDKSRAPIAKEQKHHEAGKNGSQPALFGEVFNRAKDDGRLIEFVANTDVVGHDALKFRNILLYEIDDRQSRGVGPFRDRNVNRATPIHEGVRSHYVRTVFNGRDVTQINSVIARGPQHDTFEILDVLHNGVHGNDWIEVAEIHVARGTDRVGLSHSLDN